MHSTLISFYDPLGFPSLFILRGRKILEDLSQEGLQMGWNGIKNVSNEMGMLEKLSHWVREDWNEKMH